MVVDVGRRRNSYFIETMGLTFLARIADYNLIDPVIVLSAQFFRRRGRYAEKFQLLRFYWKLKRPPFSRRYNWTLVLFGWSLQCSVSHKSFHRHSKLTQEREAGKIGNEENDSWISFLRETCAVLTAAVYIPVSPLTRELYSRLPFLISGSRIEFRWIASAWKVLFLVTLQA